MQVYRKLGDYRSERGAFSTWLHRITVNACLNARRRRLFPRLSLDRVDAAGLLPPAGMPAPLELALRNEQQRRVLHALQRLPITLRTVVVLRYYRHLSYKEIAQVLDCPVGTVRSRLHTAHERLRSELEE